jgi:hypothetical protein
MKERKNSQDLQVTGVNLTGETTNHTPVYAEKDSSEENSDDTVTGTGDEYDNYCPWE